MLVRHMNDKSLERFYRALNIDSKAFDIKWPLPNTVEVTEHEFWNWNSTYDFAGEVWLQQTKIADEWWSRSIYFADCSRLLLGGFAVLHCHWSKRVRYFEWRGCDHVFTGRRIANCLHSYTCSKCGETYEVDSSD